MGILRYSGVQNEKESIPAAMVGFPFESAEIKWIAELALNNCGLEFVTNSEVEFLWFVAEYVDITLVGTYRDQGRGEQAPVHMDKVRGVLAQFISSFGVVWK